MATDNKSAQCQQRASAFPSSNLWGFQAKLYYLNTINMADTSGRCASRYWHYEHQAIKRPPFLLFISIRNSNVKAVRNS